MHSVEQPNGVTTTYTYDELNRLLHLVVANDDDFKLFEQTYALLDDGQRDYVIEKRFDGSGNGGSNISSNVKIDWSYDGLNRLIGETYDTDSTPANGTDDFGTQDGSDYIDAYTFDLASNRRTKSHDAVGTADDANILYTYNSYNDQLEAEGLDDDQDGNIDSGTATNYAYDANGSVTAKGSDSYTWDLRNRMISATVGGITSAYTYDQDGIRTSTQVAGQPAAFYLIDANNPTGYPKPIQQSTTAGGTPTLSYILGAEIIAQSNGTTTYLLKDGHGTTRALVDSNGASVETYDFDAYGNKVDFADGAGDPLAGDPLTVWLMPDRYRDFTTHLDRAGKRDVDSWLGVMWSKDDYDGSNPDPMTLHKYLYANGNPTNASDPSGNTTFIDLFNLMGFVKDYAEHLGRQYPTIRATYQVGRAVVAAATLFTLLSDPTARDEFMMYAIAGGGDPGTILAAEFAALKAFPSAVATSGRKILYLRHIAGNAEDFFRKARQLQIAAEEGRLVRVGGEMLQSLRNGAKAIQAAYKKSVQTRYVAYLQHLGMSAAEAEAEASARLNSLQADHRIDLQVSGALSEPNSTKNVQLLDGSANGSIGIQMRNEMDRLGIKPGDIIDGIVIVK